MPVAVKSYRSRAKEKSLSEEGWEGARELDEVRRPALKLRPSWVALGIKCHCENAVGRCVVGGFFHGCLNSSWTARNRVNDCCVRSLGGIVEKKRKIVER